MPTRPINDADRRLWIAALAAFILAGITGAVFRSGLAIGFTTGLDLENIRHAHSHLMMFSWVTPVLFLLIGRSVARTPEEHTRFRRTAWWALGLGILSYPLFLTYGYGLARIGQSELPLAAMASGLNMLVWYVFVGLYAGATRGVERDRALRMWDTAATFLVLASLGAWGISVVTMAGVESMRWPVALTHLFLEYFTLGWLVAAVVGLWYGRSDRAVSAAESGALFRVALVLFLVSTAFSHIAGMPRSLVPDGLVLPARVAGAMVGLSLILFVLDSAGRPVCAGHVSRWMALALGVGLSIFSMMPGRWWADVHPLRIMYVHLVLLGVVSTALVGAVARSSGNGWSVWIFHAAVVGLLATLVPTTHFWPAAWRGAWVYDALFAGALLPVASVAIVMAHLVRGHHDGRRRANQPRRS